MSDIKNLLATAAGPNGQGDEGWHAASHQRLYFQDPRDPNESGSAELRTGDPTGSNNFVRLELYVSAERAAEVISVVTGERESVARELARKMTPSVVRSTSGAAIVAAPVLQVVESVPAPLAVLAEPPPVYTTKVDGLQFRDSQKRMELEDAARSIELKRLIKEQEDDDAEDVGLTDVEEDEA